MTIDKYVKKGDVICESGCFDNKPMIGTGVGLTTTVYGDRIMEEIYSEKIIEEW